MENFVLYLFAILVGLVLGNAAARRNAEREARQFREELMEEILSMTTYIHAEVDKDVIYFYDYETNKYLCRGETVHEVLTQFNKLYPGMIAQVESGDEEAMEIFHQGFNFLNPEIKNVKV